MTKINRKGDKALSNATLLYQRAEREWSRSRLRSAFQLFIAAAKAGAKEAFLFIGEFYDFGMGVKKDEEAALYWYRRAYRYRKDDTASNNIACILRDRGNLKRALWWFKKTVELGDCEANLDIAKIYLNYRHNNRIAEQYLKKVVKSRSKYITEAGKEEAAALLKQIRKERMKSAGGAKARVKME